jgi:hypothetical protein
MTNNTFTFTARSQKNPEKMITYTLNNGHVRLEMGNVMLEQLETAAENHGQDAGVKVGDWAKPAAVGAMQKLMQPLPLTDFDASAKGDGFRTTTWLRPGGLRLAPIVMSWDTVDNPDGAHAFVEELNLRKEAAEQTEQMPAVFDYWVSWLLAFGALAFTGVLLARLWRQKTAEL